MKKVDNFNIEDNTLRLKASHRGGGIEISLDKLGKKYKGGKMTAYQNYLGGGMLGAIQNDCNIRDWEEDNTLVAMAEKLAKHFHTITNHDDDMWESATFEENQLRPKSAY
jgi:phage tail tube protein FII